MTQSHGLTHEYIHRHTHTHTHTHTHRHTPTNAIGENATHFNSIKNKARLTPLTYLSDWCLLSPLRIVPIGITHLPRIRCAHKDSSRDTIAAVANVIYDLANVFDSKF